MYPCGNSGCPRVNGWYSDSNFQFVWHWWLLGDATTLARTQCHRRQQTNSTRTSLIRNERQNPPCCRTDLLRHVTTTTKQRRQNRATTTAAVFAAERGRPTDDGVRSVQWNGVLSANILMRQISQSAVICENNGLVNAVSRVPCQTELSSRSIHCHADAGLSAWNALPVCLKNNAVWLCLTLSTSWDSSTSRANTQRVRGFLDKNRIWGFLLILNLNSNIGLILLFVKLVACVRYQTCGLWWLMILSDPEMSIQLLSAVREPTSKIISPMILER